MSTRTASAGISGRRSERASPLPLPVGMMPELWNLTAPEKVTAVHRAYIEAGSQIVYTNTFGANRLKLGGKASVDEVVSAAIRAAKAAAEQLELDELCFVPTGEPPHKTLPEDTATAVQRLEMTRLAAEQVPGACALDLETRREGPSYTVVTARVLRTWDPEGELWLLCGTDMFLSLDKWYRSDWLLRNLCIAAFRSISSNSCFSTILTTGFLI